MILRTTIPIPKDKKKSLCNFGNHRTFALTSIFSNILDWVIPIKKKRGSALLTCNLCLKG